MRDRRRLSRTLAIGAPSARGEARTPAPKREGKLWRSDVVVERANEMAGEVDRDHITLTAHADGTVTASCRCGAFTSGPPEYVGEGLFRVKHKDCAPREAARRKR